jgi:hypothetical protein
MPQSIFGVHSKNSIRTTINGFSQKQHRHFRECHSFTPSALLCGRADYGTDIWVPSTLGNAAAVLAGIRAVSRPGRSPQKSSLGFGSIPRIASKASAFGTLVTDRKLLPAIGSPSYPIDLVVFSASTAMAGKFQPVGGVSVTARPETARNKPSPNGRRSYPSKSPAATGTKRSSQISESRKCLLSLVGGAGFEPATPGL